jgi:hypothetical protein
MICLPGTIYHNLLQAKSFIRIGSKPETGPPLFFDIYYCYINLNPLNGKAKNPPRGPF